MNFKGHSHGPIPWCYIFGSAKTDPVRFEWGFGEGRLKDKVAFFEAYKIKKNLEKPACKTPMFISKMGPVKKKSFNWTGSVFPLLIYV